MPEKIINNFTFTDPDSNVSSHLRKNYSEVKIFFNKEEKYIRLISDDERKLNAVYIILTTANKLI
jgi:hypothetical protein